MTEKNSKILIAIFLIIFTGISIALVLPGSGSEALPSEEESLKKLSLVSPDEPQKKFGIEEKAVLIEYSDFECPACAFVEANVINPVLEKKIDGLTFVFKHFPLQSIHANAVNSAIAAEAAHKQGAFFEMKTLLFQTQNDWSNYSDPKVKFFEYAKALSLNEQQFEADYMSPALRQKVLDAYDLAKDNGLNSTPTLILNGKKIKASSAEELETLILSEISGK